LISIPALQANQEKLSAKASVKPVLPSLLEVARVFLTNAPLPQSLRTKHAAVGLNKTTWAIKLKKKKLNIT
jgi:hypothetical protein